MGSPVEIKSWSSTTVHNFTRGLYKMSNLPGIKHKVIGLVSGGKDSTFNLLHCVANGHDLVALATLTPEAGIGKSQAGHQLGRLAEEQMS